MPVSPRTKQERKFAAMRIIRKTVDYNREQERKLIPPYGCLAVGGADFDYLLKATVGEAYLRVLECGGTPEEAHREAVANGNLCVNRWNEKTHKTRVSINGSYELKRWEKAGESEADSIHIHFLNLLRV